jgi:ssDNA-binding Zn-finger/Zn-ribbon topoisomerase 1
MRQRNPDSRSSSDALGESEKHAPTIADESKKINVDRLNWLDDVCPICSKRLNKLYNKTTGAAFLGCSGYPICHFTKTYVARVV